MIFLFTYSSMEKASSDSLTRVLSAADGLLASRIFLQATPPTMNQHHCNAIPFLQQNSESWDVLSDIQIKLKDFWASMMTEIAVLGFAGLDTSLDSFANSTLLFEAALGSFRNTLTGTPPQYFRGYCCALQLVTDYFMLFAQQG